MKNFWLDKKKEKEQEKDFIEALDEEVILRQFDIDIHDLKLQIMAQNPVIIGN